jgi:hypothetical protein
MQWWQKILTGEDRAAVQPVPVGREDDGLRARPAGGNLDPSWGEHYQELVDAREAWRRHPLARRLIGLTTSYTVGSGITLHSSDPALNTFIQQFWAANQLAQRIDEWSDELARSGELFPVLFVEEEGVTVRTVAALRIEAVEVDPDDYEWELRYRESAPVGAPERWWLSPQHPDVEFGTPVMLHYAVNRPTGAVRGESDLAPILPWLRRYARWLEDRVRLNAAMRTFLWIIHAPARLRTTLEERYRMAPEPGSVIIAEQDAESWTAVTPNLHAADAEKDGRALRWMIAAGGPGTALIDLGEGEDANLATGQAMAEQRRRFLRRRQSYLVWMITDLALHAYLAGAGLPRSRYAGLVATITANAPDISPEDNQALAAAAHQLTGALQTLAAITSPAGTPGPAFRKLALRLFAKFAGEVLGEQESAAILTEATLVTEHP